MADKRISDFATLAALDDNDLILVSNDSDTYNVKAGTLRRYAAEVAQEALDAAAGAQASAATAANKANNAESAATQAMNTANSANSAADGALDASEEAARLVQQLSLNLLAKVDGGYVEDGYLYLTANDEVVVGPLGPFSGTGGSGGGAVNGASLSVSNTTGWLAKTIAHGASCPVTLSWSSIEDDLETGAGSLTIAVNGTVKATKPVNQGSISVDLSEYLAVGSNTVKVKISDVYGNSRTINYSITTVSVSLTSTFDVSSPFFGAILFPYTPTGSVAKTMHFVLDNVELGTVIVSASGRQQTYAIAAQSNGTHTLRVYFTANVDSEEVSSNELFYEFMVCDESYASPLIASSFNSTQVAQFASIVIPWYVYVPGVMTASEVILKANGTVINTLTNVDRSEQSWTYRADTAGSLVLSITCGSTVKTINLTVNESIIDVTAETEDLSLFLSSYGRSNSEAAPAEWTYGSIDAELSNFNFASDGWQTDEDGITVLRVAGDARVMIPLKIFETDFRSTGKTIELEFATRDVRNYDSPILSCMAGGRGIELTAQLATFRSEQSELSMQYKEEEHVRLSFVVEKRTENRLIYCYINGVLSGVVQYPNDDDFSQISPVNISIGSNDCAMDIYCIRVYDNNLTRFQILDNWIADTQNGALMLERYDHNNVYDAYGQIVIAQLPADLPYLVLQGEALPQYKGNKLSITGYYVNPQDSSKNFNFTCSIDVQGTSSAGYARKNYKMKFSSFVDEGGNTSTTYKMRADSIPTATFTMKADVASSEGCNNVELVRLYNDACPYRTPPQVANSAVRQGIDGFPIVIFWDDGSNVTFLGKYNFNNDKGTPEVYGFSAADESWETLNNTSDRSLWKSADFSGTDWLNDYEARHPEDNTNAAKLAALAAWLVSTDQTAATGNALPAAVSYEGISYTTDTEAYRLAKFKAEFENHFVLDSALFYYLFTELFLMVDSRAKNAFPSIFSADGKWCFLPYDFDTAIGINNEGTLSFSYNLEDIDTTESGADVFNGQQSVLWVNLRQAFYAELMAMYQTLRSNKVLSYEKVEQAFEIHQAKWPEAVFNEDAYFKYIAPLLESGTAAYLSMCQGSKAEQRKWWLYNRFRYMDSKYNAGDAQSDIITLRGYAKSDITVTPYADVYAAVKYGSYLVQQRAFRNNEYTLACPLDNVNDTEIYIYSCSQLADVGDLSGLKVGYADFSGAVKLQAVKIGDAASGYTNANLTELYLGNNTLLQVVDSRNCPNLSQTIDLSGCTGIEECYFTGTAIPSLSLPNGGVLKKLHLPGTVTNLTLRNQTMLTEFSMPSISQITTLWLENVSDIIDSKAIVGSIVENSRVRLVGINWTFESAEDILALYDTLDTMRGLDENGNNMEDAQISGRIYVDSLTGAQLSEMLERYPNIVVIYQHITSYVYFYNYDGTQLLYTVPVIDGANATSPGSPPRVSTAQYDYTFVGWSYNTNATSASSNALTTVTTDRALYAAYSRITRTYTVYFYNGQTLLQTVTNVPYGGSASYTGSTPVSSDETAGDFDGWSPSPSNITGNTACYAQFESTLEVAEITDSWDTILSKIAAGTADYKVGNYKPLDLGTEGVVNMQIAGKNKDSLADGTGTALYSWISKELLNTIHRMNPDNQYVYDWPEDDSWYNSTGTTYRTRLAYYIAEATAAWTFEAATEACTKTFTYKKSNSSNTYSTLSLKVYVNNNVAQEIAAAANTSTITVTQTMDAGDVLKVEAVFNLKSASYNYYATLVFNEAPTSFETNECTYRGSILEYIESTGSIGGWEKSEMRDYLKTTVKPLIPANVRAAIKEVTKTQPACNTSGTSFTQTTTDDVWIPSYNECFGTSSAYKGLFANTSANRIKYKVGATSASIWWLRSATTTSNFSNVSSSGINSYNYATSSYGVALGFCT